MFDKSLKYFSVTNVSHFQPEKNEKEQKPFKSTNCGTGLFCFPASYCWTELNPWNAKNLSYAAHSHMACMYTTVTPTAAAAPSPDPFSGTTACDRGTLITGLGNKAKRDGHVGPGGQVSGGRKGCLGKSHHALWYTLIHKPHFFTLTASDVSSLMHRTESFHCRRKKKKSKK